MIQHLFFKPLHYCAKKNHTSVATLIINFCNRNREKIIKFKPRLNSNESNFKHNIDKWIFECKGQDGLLPLHLAAAYYGKQRNNQEVCNLTRDSQDCVYENSVLKILFDQMRSTKTLNLLNQAGNYGMNCLHHALIRGNTVKS